MNEDVKKYAVLTCDIIRSRKFETENLLKVLHKVLDAANERFADSLHRKFGIMFGDSFQAVLSNPKRFFDIFQYIEESLWLEGAEEFGKKSPILLRCGVGIGEVENPDAKLGEMTGDAFIMARNALDSIKKIHRKSIVKILSSIDVKNPFFLIAIELACTVKSHWTYSQRKIIYEYRNNKSLLQSDIADKFNISRPYISKIFKETEFEKIEYMEKIIREE